MSKIVVTQELGLQPDQIARLNALGKVKMYTDVPADYDEWVERVRDADIICSGKFGLEQRGHTLKDKFISVPFVGVGWYDSEKGKADNLLVANAPGGNKYAVSEWAVAMLLNLVRQLPRYINAQPCPEGARYPTVQGLDGMKVLILGAGNIGQQIARVCEALAMEVSYFRRGDDLRALVTDKDVLVNCLSVNPSTINLLNSEFFKSLKRGSYYVSIANNEICDTEALLAALNDGTLAGAATDCASVQIGGAYDPYYVRLSKHPKVLATPHIAYNTTTAERACLDMMIDNVEAWLHGRPQNIIGGTVRGKATADVR